MTYLGGASREMEHTVKYNARSRRLGVGKSGLDKREVSMQVNSGLERGVNTFEHLGKSGVNPQCVNSV